MGGADQGERRVDRLRTGDGGRSYWRLADHLPEQAPRAPTPCQLPPPELPDNRPLPEARCSPEATLTVTAPLLATRP